jgi:hypothetical protein
LTTNSTALFQDLQRYVWIFGYLLRHNNRASLDASASCISLDPLMRCNIEVDDHLALFLSRIRAPASRSTEHVCLYIWELTVQLAFPQCGCESFSKFNRRIEECLKRY